MPNARISHKRKKSARSKRSRAVSAAARPSLLQLFPEYRKKRFRARVEEQRKRFIDELREAYLHRGLVLYLGAGVSRSVRLPGWAELIRSLTVTMMSRRVRTAIDALEELSDEQRWEAIGAIQQDVERGADYDKPILMMARAIKDELGDRLPWVIANILYARRLFFHRRTLAKRFPGSRLILFAERDRQRLPSSPLLDSIVALARAERDVNGVQAIVNYNYDDLIDEKLRQQNVRCITVRSGRDRVPPGTLPCYHVHGVLPMLEIHKLHDSRQRKAIGNFVFSEDEYHAEYSDPYRWSNMTQMSHLGRYTGLFVGLSMEDPNLRRLIDVTHKQYPEIANYAILTRRKPLSKSRDSKQNVLTNLFEEVETSSFDKIGVKVLWVDNYDQIPVVLKQVCKLDS